MSRLLRATQLNGAVTLPSASIVVAAAAGFATNGRIQIGAQIVAYTGVSGNTFTGCTGGSGTFPDATEVDELQPANYATTVQFLRVWNIQYPELADALTVTINVSGATSWVLRDMTGAVVTSGVWSGTTQTIGTAGIAPFDKYGLYRFQLLGPDRADGRWTTDYGCCQLLLARDVALIPRAPLRVTNPPNQSAGLDAPALHGYCSYGSFRVEFSAQNIAPARQIAGGTTASGTGVTATLTGGGFGGAVTPDSMVVLVHTVVGDDTGMASDVTNGVVFNTTADVSVGAGATKVHTRVYYFHCALHPAWSAGNSFPTFTCTTTNASKQSLVAIEHGPHVANAAPLAFATTSGSSNPAVITKDMTSIAGGNEYGVIAAISADQGSCTSNTGVPSVTPDFAAQSILSGSCDSYGGGSNHTNTYQLAGSPTNWTAVFVAFASGVTYAAALADAQTLLTARYNAWGQYQDPARPYRKVSVSTLQETSSAAVSHYLAGITQLVTDSINYIPGLIGCYTSRNEPQGTYSMVENNLFCGAVYAGNAGAVAAVPGYVTLDYNEQADFFAFCDAGMLNKGTGGGNAMHYHDYNMGIDFANCLAVHRSLRAGLASRSLDSLPIYMTEGGTETTWFPGGLGLSMVWTMGPEWMMKTLAGEILLGMPYEHRYWYYDIRSGFDAVVTWQANNGGVLPGPAMHRAFAVELGGKTFEHALSFGDVYDSYVIGGVWRNASDQTGNATVMAARGVPPITFAIGGPLANVPATITTKDCWGNPTTVAVTGRTFTIPVDAWPTHIVLPAGVDIAARPVNSGRSGLTVGSLAITDDGDGGAAPVQMRKMVDGAYVNSYAWASEDNTNLGNAYQTRSVATTFPRNLTFTTNFGAVIRADTISCYTPAIWQAMGAILKGKLQYTTDGVTWLDPADPAASWDLSATTTIKCYDYANDTLVDCYTLPRQYFEASLGGVVVIMGVRVVATLGTAGFYVDSMMSNPPGGITSSIPLGVAVAEVNAFDRAAQGFPARR